MAGDWLKMRHDLVDDPAVDQIAELTGLDNPAVLGRVFLVWRWADRQSRDGHAAVTLAYLDRVALCNGFANAMVTAGWLVEQEAGKPGVIFPNFDRHISKSAKTRGLAAQRQARHRTRGKKPLRKRNGRVTPKSRPSVTREEKSSSSYEEEQREDGCEDAHDIAAVELADRLRACILAHKPDARLPTSLMKWAGAFRLMLEHDNRARDRIEVVMDWATADPFWRPNILSAEKLREKFDTLEMQMQRSAQPPRTQPMTAAARSLHNVGVAFGQKP